ncbi:MAG: hypothetical protein KGD59_02240 [Candidatus Heimdallarchaeota archaeon]|nr:hypothetical protein [Candidatus Heimdallarchaeota archaeon]MBY8993341.1 hypothetical protein [Candidatus Heimdallarchaeota archaeon]
MAEEEPKSWISYKKAKFVELLYKPFIVYGKQFFKFFLVALITEFIVYGVSLLFQIDITVQPTFNGPALGAVLEFRGDADTVENFQTLLAVLALPTILIFLYRSTIISNMAWKTIEDGKTNVFWSISRSIRKTKELLVFLAFIGTLIAFPVLLIILGIILQGHTFLYAYVFGWMFVIFSIVIPLIFYSRSSLYIAGMAKDNLHVGAALQTSWQFSARRNYYRVTFTFIIFLILGLLIPYGLTLYLTNIYSGWADKILLIMVFVKALLYPLFDIGLTFNYMHLEHHSVEQAVFRDAIIEQKKRSEEVIRKGIDHRNF